ncbi:MAG: ABC transporter ATP-binding protein [Pseudanabaena sp.]|jgi:phospholipid/cholesterol/gamma-HCH transport system ATP-binding protein|uniref:ABC transporter ATP-binding protein n=1 Tax=Pseudanabaena mucicola TaxID=71190 RepID=UPI0025773DED|nr:ATP-binding cassette domain-containing protein [Pseudanabaena mucicola]MCA6523197.1 ATP-binding cassette domain-containing protein [Pseudanabaena sp. M051S1SP2A07QC]MCA6572238.1 ATP-binding cassette domain-containing protein [Pseudanabaena sp. M53BS1SP1A06MG]MCA6580973.1 ATP-binding cassette domain-containing protein [Pseudanabaena sp. M34BS1SP1A06MG]MCA6589938.1 ATP-binding cassette domain-containing protein [Pseudanabaena sp. M109S1SP1A06QC]MCA6592143.1 ATP-binding cassette domain-contain
MEPVRSLTKKSSSVVTPLLELRGIHKSFGQNPILKGFDLTVHSGEAIAIIGPSGTGKSTILRVICGLLTADSGEVYVNGNLVESEEDIQEGSYGLNIGMVFQSAALFDSLTVAENVGFSLFEHSRLSRREIYRLVEQKLALVGLENISNRYPSQLSGGMRKRVSFARAIMDDPTTKTQAKKILLYDEPTAGLDPIASTIIEDLMRSLRDQQVCDSYIVVTHQDSTIRRTADRLMVLYRGSVRYAGNVSTIDTADNPYVRQFFSGSTEGPIQLLTKEV